jgi:glutathione S-transferase
MGPRVGEPLRGPYLSWLAYYAGVFEPAFVSKFLKFSPPRGAAGWVALEEMMDHVNKTLEQGPYLLGERFSAADVLYASSFALFMNSPLLPKTPQLEHYVKRCTERPACLRAATKSA